MSITEELYDCNSAAHMLKISTDHLRLLARAGKIACNKRGKKFIFTQSQLDAYRVGKPYMPAGKK